MKRTAIFTGLAMLSLLTADELQAQLRAQAGVPKAIFRADAQMVLVPVTVVDHNGKTVSGLQAQDFTVLDEKTPQEIVSFTNEDAPSSVGLVLDISGSMKNALNTSKNVAHEFFKAANPEDEFLLLTVSTQPAAVSGFTRDTDALEQSINFTKPEGMTALIDTVYLALNKSRKASQARRALLILSDGLDNYSRYSESELMRVALEADVQVYSIIMNTGTGLMSGGTVPFRPSMAMKPADQARERQGPNLLEKLSTQTGGLYFHVKGEAEAREAAAKISLAIRNEYMIGYRPVDSGLSGKWHRVKVKSTVPKVNVYAREGYYAR